jgi:hypothetical protein
MILRIGLESYPQTRWMGILLGPAPRDDERENWVLSWWRRLHS